MEKIPALIFSKNRASQLRLLVESLHFNATGIFQPYVVWQANTPEFEQGYHKLFSEQMDIFHVRESYMLDNLYAFLNNFKDGHFALFMDDCIFYKPLRVSPEDLISRIDDDTWCLSLRLGYNTTENTEKPIVSVSEDGDFIKYKFKEHGPHDNYGFCFSWDGVIYKTQDVLDLFNGNTFTQTHNQWAILPQKIENFTSHNRDEIKKDLICCSKESHVVCMNYNSTHPMAHFNMVSLESLNSSYLAGEIIDFNSINFDGIKGTHETRPFSLRYTGKPPVFEGEASMNIKS